MRILFFISALFTSLYLNAANPVTGSVAIFVEAGDAQTICYGETLDLNVLGASISGDVDDGLWFTTGDGIFLPGGGTNGIFSVTDQYQPGPQDQINGDFTLILVSDDPDGNGPMVEVSDEVLISFMNAPALVCNNAINISLAEACQQEVDIFMLLANPSEPYEKYTIELFDENDILIPGNLLTVEHIGMNISFIVGHACTNSTCGGTITVTDNIPPFLNCVDAEVDCEYGVSPDSTGFPVPFYAVVSAIDDNTYLVENFDACSNVTLTYQDSEVEMACASTGYIKEITRLWTAEDESGNTSNCTQIILVNPLPLSAVGSPPDYDGSDQPPLSCDGDWEALPNGYPSPESTGMPDFPDCANIETTYTDVYFEECGAGFKIVRQWFVIDWCTTESFNENQIIKVLDLDGPVFECPEDLTLSSQPYVCGNSAYQLTFVDSVYDCSSYDYSFKILTLDDIDISDAYLSPEFIVEDLPVGEYQLIYVGTDVCNNVSQCTTALYVVDDSAPFAVCDGFTQIALTSNGEAELLATSVDDESFDNCGIISMEIAKMTDECGWGLQFGPTVRFCCEEVGDTVMVAFRVTDEQGLMNTCMVSVFIEDKLPPTIECPSDITISCSLVFDPEDLSIFGSVVEGTSNPNPILIDGEIIGFGGYYYDNCEASVSETSTVDLECGSGTITRTFTATDLYDQSMSCTQTITIVNDDPFLESDIVWPSNFEMNGCDTIQANQSVTGEPTWLDNKCALVSANYHDQIFYISGGACIKILREWTVIDWCQYEPGQSFGIWSYLQEIKLKNNVDPVILDCEDKEVCSFDENCTSELVTFTALANDDCTDSLKLLYLWELDIDDDGVIDEVGEGISFSEELLYGDHRVFWTVEDGCGNAVSCDYKVTVRDCKNPTPYCNSSITTTIMPSAGMIQIWASDFDFGSYDNCTAPEDLVFSFSQDTNDISRTILCEDIINGIAQEFIFELWVTDEYGNQERCDVRLVVQDNQDACPNGTIKGKISGKVMSQHDAYIPDVEMEYTSSIDSFSGMEITDGEGVFELDTTPEYLKYVFRPKYESDPNSGVSTLDLVLIQRHILGIAPFDNAYNILASDVSGNEKVSSSDLVTLRKMVLGIIPEWPKDQENWVFVDSLFEFQDINHPWNYPDSVVIDALKDTADHINFIAVKMGDVNGSFDTGLKSDKGTSSSRNEDAFLMDVLSSTQLDGDILHEFSLYSDERIDGLQFSMSIPRNATINSEFLSSDDYVIEDGILSVSWVNTIGNEINDRSFFVIRTDVEFDYMISDHLNAEIYIELEPVRLDINSLGNEFSNDAVSIDDELPVIQANPTSFYEDLNLSISKAVDNVDLEILNSNGQLVFKGAYQNTSSIRIPYHHFGSNGLYFVKARMDGIQQSIKVIKVN